MNGMMRRRDIPKCIWNAVFCHLFDFEFYELAGFYLAWGNVVPARVAYQSREVLLCESRIVTKTKKPEACASGFGFWSD